MKIEINQPAAQLAIYRLNLVFSLSCIIRMKVSNFSYYNLKRYSSFYYDSKLVVLMITLDKSLFQCHFMIDIEFLKLNE